MEVNGHELLPPIVRVKKKNFKEDSWSTLKIPNLGLPE
jgi:hypothetical protein